MAVILRVCVPADVRAPAAARAALRGLSGIDGMRDVAALLVSELVTNSVRHGGLGADEEIEVVVRDGEVLRVEVTDGGPGLDGRRDRTIADGDGGRGLFLVEALAARWGAERSGRARVWFELDGRVAAGQERRLRPAPGV